MMALHATTEPNEADELSAMVREQSDRLFAGLATREALAAADALAHRGATVAFPSALWSAVEDAGWPLALAAEDAGGLGLAAGDALRIVRSAAYHALPLPLAECMAAQALWASAAGATAPGILTIGTGDLAVSDGALHGTLSRVPWGADTDAVLVAARDADDAAVFALVSPPADAWTRETNLAGEPRDTVRLDGADAQFCSAPGAGDLLATGAALRAVQMVGAMERALDHALTHANERTQFGRPIAKFQAIQHLLAEAAGHLAAAAALVDCVAEAWGTDDLVAAAALAKSRSGEAAGRVAAASHQVLAAMGFTQEHQLHYATRRLWSWRDEFGGEAMWEARIGRMACAGGGEALWDMIVASSQPGVRP